MLPFDIIESTWLVNPPGRILSREELIGYRTQALSKHNTFVLGVQRRVDENKRRELKIFEEKYRHVIKDWDFKPGQLIQVRHSNIEKNLDRKMFPRYKGPMVVIRRTRGGSYIVAEMDVTVLRRKVGAFRCLPHFARYEPIELPENIHDLIDISTEELEQMIDDEPEEYGTPGTHYVFDAIPNLRLPGTEQDSDDEEDDTDIEVDELLEGDDL